MFQLHNGLTKCNAACTQNTSTLQLLYVTYFETLLVLLETQSNFNRLEKFLWSELINMNNVLYGYQKPDYLKVDGGIEDQLLCRCPRRRFCCVFVVPPLHIQDDDQRGVSSWHCCQLFMWCRQAGSRAAKDLPIVEVLRLPSLWK